MVKKDSISINSSEVKFIITDFKNEITVSLYWGNSQIFLRKEKGWLQKVF
jgi:cytochrome c-type biogenesis protein CcmE